MGMAIQRAVLRWTSGAKGDTKQSAIRTSKENPVMGKGRLEAFSDGVLAIILTIMVLELKVPSGGSFAALKPILPTLLSYVLSFIYIAIYWNNHHHMLQTCRKVTGAVLWANLHLLFWLSLTPFTTGWMGQNHFSAIPSSLYGFVLLMSGAAYWILQQVIIHLEGRDSLLARAVGFDWKGKLSLFLYACAIVLSLKYPWVAQTIYALVALMWVIPDRRIECTLHHHELGKKGGPSSGASEADSKPSLRTSDPAPSARS